MSTERSLRTGLLPLVLLAACGQAPAAAPQTTFPAASRPVATIVSPRFSTEPERDQANESRLVMDIAGTKPGMSVADVGAGEGYYTVRLAKRVGPKGRVVGEDIFPDVRDKLAERVARAGLKQVTVTLGTANDPKLAANTFDQIYLVHMYHEIAAPYEFLWRLRPALKPGGRVVIVDADRPTANHGTPPALLDCELAAVGYTRVRRERIAAVDAYVALYEARGQRPEPAAIKPCKA